MSEGIDGVTQRVMKDIFNLSGPLHLTTLDWKNADHRRSVAACLVHGVYVLERDRQKNRQGPHALASPWWNFFHFQLNKKLVDVVDSSIFGVIYEFKPPSSGCMHLIQDAPKYVIAFRGTIMKRDSGWQDLRLDLHFIRNWLHRTSRFEIAMGAVQNVVARCGDLNIWIAGHSLGSAIGMLAGKSMARTGVFLEAFLFNPPFFSLTHLPFLNEIIRNEKVKHMLRIVRSLVTARLAVVMKGHNQRPRSDDPFIALAAWVPSLFVHPADHICSAYINYFEHRKYMEDIGAEAIERLATQNSLPNLCLKAVGRESDDPLHLLPSASLTVNPSRAVDFQQAHGIHKWRDFKQVHGIHQWWSPDLHLHLQSKLYQYS
ncbi:hypothetical protein IFM89_014202 [Coptis chinensis]|uniref:Fungal lipase-type domain-containing protein n=1 Tax=Coptis chinensis TaxID=261450 RepID=A0A835MCQ3_9MAGN|nr:hypothetical protein IFM89_014202 [Coptis chinensis]